MNTGRFTGKTANILLFLLLHALFLPGQAPPSHQEEASALYQTISRFQPRPEGSENERLLIRTVTEYLTPLGYTVSVSPFSNLAGTHSFSSIVEIRKEGATRDRLVIALPIDSPAVPRAENDGSAAVAAVLLALREISGRQLEKDLTVLLLGGEFGTGGSYPLGTREFLSTYYPDGGTGILYIDIPGPPERVYIDGGSDISVSPAWMVILVQKLLHGDGLGSLFLGNANQVYRVGKADQDTPIRWFMEAGYPAIRLASGKKPYEGSAAEWVERFAGFTRDFILSTPTPIPADWDTHYLIFQARRLFIVIPELPYILTILFLFLGIVLYTMIRGKGVRRYLRAMFRHFWALPILVGIIFLCLLAGTAAARIPLVSRHFPMLWRHIPILFFLLKTGIALSLFSLLFYFRKFFLFSYNSSFYSSSALILLISAVTVSALFDISLSYYFIWAFLFAFLFSIVPNRYGKVACFVLSLVWIMKWLYDIFTFPFLSVSSILMFSWIKGNLLFALSVLPFILMIIRLDFLFRHPLSKRQRIIMRSITLFFGSVGVAAMSYLLLFSPFSPESPQPVSVTETRDETAGSRILRIDSEAPIGIFTLSSGGERTEYSTKQRTWSVPLPATEPLISYSLSSSRFLDREYARLTIDPQGNPESIGLTLKSGGDSIVLYDCNFPFSYDSDGLSVRIHIGTYPPLPLLVEFTVPSNLPLTGEISAEYRTLPYDMTFEGKEKDFSSILRARTDFPLSGGSGPPDQAGGN